MGLGPMTGRAAGFCAGYDVPGYMNPVGGRGYFGRGFGRGLGLGYGRGFGFGRGYGRGFVPAYPVSYSPYSPAATAENERKYLESDLTMLKEEMANIEARLKEIKEAEEK
jgi:hypothetical protein